MEHNEYNDLMKRIKCSDEFRSKMQKQLSSEPVAMETYEESVSGTDIAPKRSWTRYAAMAAAFVLVCGAVGGAAYGLRQHDKNQPSQVIAASTDTAANTGETVSASEAVTETDAAESTAPSASETVKEAVPRETILSLLPETDNNVHVCFKAGPTMVPQGKLLYGTSIRGYDVIDYDELRNKLAEIEWTVCSEEEVMQNETFEYNGLTIATGCYHIYNADFNVCDLYAHGFIRSGSTYYKPLRENDLMIAGYTISNHFVPNKCAELAAKINNLPTALTADYTYYTPYEQAHGKILFGNNQTMMYMDGEGSMNNGEKHVEMVMKPEGKEYDTWNGSPTVLRVTDKNTGKHEYSLKYMYSNGILEYQPSFHYVYLLKDIERDIAGELRGAYKDLEFTSNDNEDGTTTYYIKRAELLYENDDSSKEGSITELTVVTDKNDHLISYERKLNGSLTCSFKLENYKFDTEDFTMEDYNEIYSNIELEAETSMN